MALQKLYAPLPTRGLIPFLILSIPPSMASIPLSDPPVSPKPDDVLAMQRAAYHRDPVPRLEARQQDLRTLRRFVKKHTDDFCAAICADYGHRPRQETLLTEIIPVLQGIDHALQHLRKWSKPQRRGIDRLSFGLASNRVIPQPLGVIGVIVPWNFPLNLSLIPLTAIFAAGNRAMVKMSENSRHLARFLIETIPAYFPPEKLQFIDETGGVGMAFSRLPFDHLLFTGSGSTGRAVMTAAAQNLCPVTLELGGKAPAVICPDFPIHTAVERILFVKCLNAGQICTTVDHVYVPRGQEAAFVEHAQAITARRYCSLSSKDYTSIIDTSAFARLGAALDEARDLGARVINLLPGPAIDPVNRKIAPHLVLGAPPDCALMQREIFGPILPVVPYDSLDGVIDQINAGPRPLALYPFSYEQSTVEKLLDRVMSGGVSINDALFHVGQHDLPFGGVGASGMGHYHGREGFETFSKMRPVFRQARWSTLALLAPPYGKMADRILAFLSK